MAKNIVATIKNPKDGLLEAQISYHDENICGSRCEHLTAIYTKSKTHLSSSFKTMHCKLYGADLDGNELTRSSRCAGCRQAAP
jgi:hypothetical protein